MCPCRFFSSRYVPVKSPDFVAKLGAPVDHQLSFYRSRPLNRAPPTFPYAPVSPFVLQLHPTPPDIRSPVVVRFGGSSAPRKRFDTFFFKSWPTGTVFVHVSRVPRFIHTLGNRTRTASNGQLDGAGHYCLRPAVTRRKTGRSKRPRVKMTPNYLPITKRVSFYARTDSVFGVQSSSYTANARDACPRIRGTCEKFPRLNVGGEYK